MTKYLLRRCMAWTAALALVLVSASVWSQGPPTAPIAEPAPQNVKAVWSPEGVLLTGAK
jgi:hypothetical protein